MNSPDEQAVRMMTADNASIEHVNLPNVFKSFLRPEILILLTGILYTLGFEISVKCLQTLFQIIVCLIEIPRVPRICDAP